MLSLLGTPVPNLTWLVEPALLPAQGASSGIVSRCLLLLFLKAVFPTPYLLVAW